MERDKEQHMQVIVSNYKHIFSFTYNALAEAWSHQSENANKCRGSYHTTKEYSQKLKPRSVKRKTSHVQGSHTSSMNKSLEQSFA